MRAAFSALVAKTQVSEVSAHETLQRFTVLAHQ
jgi:hypothetical protein